jgi:D-alanyl-lipoteichoic acid acyltransferase DltB (MBOAT superfamily)
VRASDLLPQLVRRAGLDAAAGSRGLFLIGIGLAKKMALADPLALNLVDRVFDLPEQFSSLEVLAGVYGYALQIYCDFSGYSDIAIGSALLIGVRFPENFDSPYQARSLSEFWRRWHISLSSWLRDYLYVPLGGNRHGRWRTYRNLLVTMLLGGLWHGASWSFVLWGALHGGALAAVRWFGEVRGPAPTRGPRWSGARSALGWFLTFHYVCLAWVFFRAPTLADAGRVLGALGAGSWHAANLTGPVVALLAAGFATHFLPRARLERFAAAYARWPAPLQAAALLALILGLARLASSEVVPFIYFQF